VDVGEVVADGEDGIIVGVTLILIKSYYLVEDRAKLHNSN
jgi:hypothetical protein